MMVLSVGMVKQMKNSRFVYSLSFIAIMFCSVLSFVPANENPTARNVVKKANDTTLDVDLSKTYAQIGSHDGVDKLRFVTAIDMSNENVEKVNYTRIADFAATTTVEKEVTSLYKSVAGSEDTVYYYDGTELVNSNPENGYYFANYVVAYKSSANKANLFTVAMDVNDDAAKAPFLTTSYNAIAASEANAVASFVVDGELVGRCIVEQGSAPVYYLGTEEGQYWSDGVNYFEELPTITTDTEFTLVSFADIQTSAKATIAGYQLVAGEYTEANLAEYNSVISKAQASVDAATTLDDVNYIVKNAKYDVERLPELFSYTPISTVEEWKSLIAANPAGNFKLMNDIDLGNASANISESEPTVAFSGILDGQGYAIKNGYIASDANYRSVLGDTAAGAVIKNIAFLNILGPTTLCHTAIVDENKGTMENIYVDWKIREFTAINNPAYGAGTLVHETYKGTLQNCVVNLSFANEVTQDSVDAKQGSLIGNANQWNSAVKNCHAITNGTWTADITGNDMVNNKGITVDFKNANCAQHNSYYHMYKDAKTSIATFDSNLWEFTENGIKFGKSVNYTDEYTYISSFRDWLDKIPANPAGKFRLVNDLDFNNTWLTGSETTTLANSFTGILDGMGHEIINAKLPGGGWLAGKSLFYENRGIIKNISFIGLQSHATTTENAIIDRNRGLIKNIYVDFVYNTSAYDGSSFNGVIAAFCDNDPDKTDSIPCEIRNSIVNFRMADGAYFTENSHQGSIVGKAGGWSGYVKNCYAITNGCGVERICYVENGTVAASTMKTSAQYDTYNDLYSTADVSMYHGNIWSFTETGITFFGRQVLTYTAPEVTA